MRRQRRRGVRIKCERLPTCMRMNKEMCEEDDYKIEGISIMNNKKKTRNNQNKRDLLNYPFVLSSHIYFFSLLTLFSLTSVV